MTTVEAIFENGVFKPVKPVALPEKQRVEIDVRLVPPSHETVVTHRPSAELLRSAGSLDADVPDLCERLDDYLGEALSQELQGKPNA